MVGIGKARRSSFRARFTVLACLAVTVAATAAAVTGPASSAVQSSASDTAVKRGGTLQILGTLGLPWDCNFNALRISLNYWATQWAYVYEPLIVTNGFARAGVPSEYPWLATSYKWSNDNRSVTFTIRKGVTWSDGQPFTAKDVLYTFNLIKKNPALDVAGAWQALSSIKLKGTNQIVAGIKRGRIPGFTAIASNTYIVPEHIWKSIKNPVTYIDRRPIGTGPFTIQNCSPQVIAYQRNPAYWQKGRPYIDRIIMPNYKSNDSANHDIVGKLGDSALGLNFIPAIEKQYVARDPKYRQWWFPPVNNWSLTPNVTNPLLKDKRVRQAIAYAIDRSEVGQKAEFGYIMPASQTGNIQPFKAWYNRAADAKYGFYRHNPRKAISLLQQAGYTRASDGVFRTPNGEKLTVTLIHVGAYSDSVAATTIMARQLREVGFDAKPESLSGNVYYSRLSRGDFTLAWAQVTGSVAPFYEYRNLLHSENSAPNGKPALSNYQRWRDPATDRLLNAYGLTRDLSKQRKIINQIQQIMVDQAPVIPVLQGVVWHEWSDRMFVGWATKEKPYVNPCGYCTTDFGMGVVLTRIHLR